ncbi:MAG: ABC transporter substrate-binding protein [bacterium]|nr:ABC transporter substrate-binding protein [bacterium]
MRSFFKVICALFFCISSADADLPRLFGEAPMLAERVRRGELPPVEDRLPDEPLVVVPLEEVGEYGGSWLRMMKGTSDFHAFGRCIYEQMLRWAPNPKDGIVPGLVVEWAFSDGGRVLTIRLRKGLKWSDGHPFSTDDIMFWWEKIAQDLNLSPGIPREWSPGGVPMVLTQVDAWTVQMQFAKPYPMAIQYLAFKGHQWPLVFERAGFFAPKHYLEKYLPDSGSDDLTMASYAIFEEKANDFNTDRPVISAWKITEWRPGDYLTAERNPYYWKVDTAGNQLPYLDKVEVEIFLNQEMLNFRAVSGVMEMQIRHFSVQDIDLLTEFANKRGYRIIRYEGTSRSAVMLNLQYPGDLVLQQVFQDKRFRIALSLAIDREMICKLCFRGLTRPGEIGLFPASPDYVEVPNLPDHWSYDPERSNALLDAMGLDKRDGEGYRLRLDGEQLSLILETSSTVRSNLDMLEIVRSNWEAVGVRTTLKPEERTLYFQRVTKNGVHMIGNWGYECVFPTVSSHRWFGSNLWDEWAHHWAEWYLSDGKKGVEPPPEVKRLQEIEEELQVTVDAQRRRALWAEVIQSHAENIWIIPLIERTIGIGVLAENFRNVPEEAVSSWIVMTPGNLNPETFFIKK